MLAKSNELRKAIVNASKVHNIPFAHACDYLGIDYLNFTKMYLNRNDLSSSTPHTVKDEELIKMSALLGFDIRVVIVKKSDFNDKEKLRKELADAYKEKRIASETKKANKRNGSTIA